MYTFFVWISTVQLLVNAEKMFLVFCRISYCLQLNKMLSVQSMFSVQMVRFERFERTKVLGETIRTVRNVPSVSQCFVLFSFSVKQLRQAGGNVEKSNRFARLGICRCRLLLLLSSAPRSVSAVFTRMLTGSAGGELQLELGLVQRAKYNAKTPLHPSLG